MKIEQKWLSRILNWNFVGLVLLTGFILTSSLHEESVAATTTTIINTTTASEGSDETQPMILNTETTECPTKCFKYGKCDKLCRTRYVAEQQMIEKIQSLYAASNPQGTLIQTAAADLDQSRFCPKETIRMNSPTGVVLNLVNEQGFKGADSAHYICTAANGFTPNAAIPPTVYQPASTHTYDDPPNCNRVTYSIQMYTQYYTPHVAGRVMYRCTEDAKTKTMSWKLMEGCQVNIPFQNLVTAPFNVVVNKICCPAGQEIVNIGGINQCQDIYVPPPEDTQQMCTVCTMINDGDGGGCNQWETVPCSPNTEAPPPDTGGGDGSGGAP